VRETTPPTLAPTPPAVTLATVPDPGLPPPLGLLQVAVRPWGEVSVDGKVVGTTPLDRISIAAGVHVVRVRHPSYEAVERSITVRAGEISKLVVDLPSLAARKQP
jgi:serine/threonine-protein kinase